MEVKLLEDTVSRAKEQLEKAEEELSSLDSKQIATRKELKECENELASSQTRVANAEREHRELGENEATLSKKSTDLLVSSRLFERGVDELSSIDVQYNHSCFSFSAASRRK
jgi:chromosome segregation ATPase